VEDNNEINESKIIDW